MKVTRQSKDQEHGEASALSVLRPFCGRFPVGGRRGMRSSSMRSALPSERRGAAIITTLFVMAVTSVLVIGILDSHTTRFGALHNTVDYDRARYLAEAGLNQALAQLESNIDWRSGVPRTEFPAGSGEFFSATATSGSGSTVQVVATGESGSFTRTLSVIVKQGG